MSDTAAIRVVLVLLLVLGLILGCAWLARRAGWTARGAGGLLRLVGSLPLGPRAHVAVVEIEGTWLVLGVAQQGLTLLHTLPAGAAPAPGRGFRGELSARLRRPGA